MSIRVEKLSLEMAFLLVWVEIDGKINYNVGGE